MDPAIALLAALLALLTALEATYLGYHVAVSGRSRGYTTPKGYVANLPVVAFHIPVKGESPVLLERLMASIRQLNYPKDKMKVVVVCDDHDPEPLAKVLRGEGELNIVLMCRKGGRGFKAGALNEALNVESDVVVVLDVDSVVSPDFLLKALPSLYESNDVAAVVTRWEPLNPKETPISEAVSFGQRFFTRGLFRGLQAAFRSSFLVGNGCLLKRRVLLMSGRWNERCVLEDVELGVRLRLKGYRVVYNDEAVAWVEHPATYRDLKGQQRRWACGASQVMALHFKRILTSKLSVAEKLNMMIYLTQYWGMASLGASMILIPILSLLGAEPPLLMLLPFAAVWLLIATIYGYRMVSYGLGLQKPLQAVRVLGRTSALVAAMSLSALTSSLRPIFRAGCTWVVTPKGPRKRTSRGLLREEAGLSALLLLSAALSALKATPVLLLWSLMYLAPLLYVLVRRR
ncbi:MAG: glycosyltransferase family 2 protein [Desulfurococcaceae archaeon]